MRNHERKDLAMDMRIALIHEISMCGGKSPLMREVGEILSQYLAETAPASLHIAGVEKKLHTWVDAATGSRRRRRSAFANATLANIRDFEKW
jgi:hypothetical protein